MNKEDTTNFVRLISGLAKQLRGEEMTEATQTDLQAQLDGAHRETARLLALLAAITKDTVLTIASDIEEPGWYLLHLPMAGFIHTWHISPSDAELFHHVPLVSQSDERAKYDGHTTEQKYDRIQHHIFQITRG